MNNGENLQKSNNQFQDSIISSVPFINWQGPHERCQNLAFSNYKPSRKGYNKKMMSLIYPTFGQAFIIKTLIVTPDVRLV